jgi:RNA polymerase sigma-70 factor (sigma-E family)
MSAGMSNSAGAKVEPVTQGQEFGEFYQSHRLGLLRLAYLLSGDQGRAEDAVAEAVARVWLKWQSGGVAEPAGYLRRAVINEVLRSNRRRALERRLGQLRSGDHRGVRTVADHVTDREAIWRALLILPAPQRVAIVLRYYEGLSEAETANELGTRVGTIKSRVARGMDRLRVALKEHTDAEDGSAAARKPSRDRRPTRPDPRV